MDKQKINPLFVPTLSGQIIYTAYECPICDEVTYPKTDGGAYVSKNEEKICPDCKGKIKSLIGK